MVTFFTNILIKLQEALSKTKFIDHCLPKSTALIEKKTYHKSCSAKCVGPDLDRFGRSVVIFISYQNTDEF
jgi:hypothetical protein